MSDVQVTTTEATTQVIDDIPGDSTPQVEDGTPVHASGILYTFVR